MTLDRSATLKITVGAIIALLSAATVGSWKASAAWSAMAVEVRDMRREVHEQGQRAWTVTDMDRWSRQLDQRNRGLGIHVPDPREIHP